MRKVEMDAEEGTLSLARQSRQRRFKELSKKPRLMGSWNLLHSIPSPALIGRPEESMIRVTGKIGTGRIARNASGWYPGLSIATVPEAVPVGSDGAIGIGPGHKHPIALSTQEKADYPKELRRDLERVAHRRKNRYHELKKRQVAENAVTVFKKDNLRGIACAGFGKSVAPAGHGQLRSMQDCKSHTCCRQYIAVSMAYTGICPCCGPSFGPHGRGGLKVWQWVCKACGTLHDRDVSARINTPAAGVGTTHRRAA